MIRLRSLDIGAFIFYLNSEMVKAPEKGDT